MGNLTSDFISHTSQSQNHYDNLFPSVPNSIISPYNVYVPELLLQTKLFIPPLRPNLVPRPHLIERLSQGIQLGHKLTLISAPAGFGKTTLVSEWVNQKAEGGGMKDESEETSPFWLTSSLLYRLSRRILEKGCWLFCNPLSHRQSNRF